jgi:hypothetical protein
MTHCRSILSTECSTLPACRGSLSRRANERINPSLRSTSLTRAGSPSLLTWPPSKFPSIIRRFELENEIVFREFFCIA